MNGFVNMLIARMKEPSTWAGIGSLVAAVGITIKPELWQSIASLGLAIGGLLSVFLPENKA